MGRRGGGGGGCNSYNEDNAFFFFFCLVITLSLTNGNMPVLKTDVTVVHCRHEFKLVSDLKLMHKQSSQCISQSRLHWNACEHNNNEACNVLLMMIIVIVNFLIYISFKEL